MLPIGFIQTDLYDGALFEMVAHKEGRKAIGLEMVPASTAVDLYTCVVKE
jgi:hypothetical protein